MLRPIFNKLMGTFGRLTARGSLPDYDGRETLEGLNHPVEIVFDESGVPHIYAQAEADCFFAQGYIHARERLWQMEFSRRLCSGTLAEAMGEKPISWRQLSVRFRDRTTVDLDRFMRVLGLRRAAEASLEQLDDDYRALLDAYVAGVNQAIIRPGVRFPVEFSMLGYHPSEWTAVDTLLVGKGMAFQLNFGWKQLLSHWGIEHRLAGADDLIQSLFPPDYELEDPHIIQFIGDEAEEALAFADAVKNFAGWGGIHVGSNAWVVSGEMTETGSPFLANDPHLMLTSPPLFYLNELQAEEDDYHVVGASIPGAPGVLLGHNESIAWGFTNAMAHDCDFYREKLDPEDDDRYFVGDESRPMETRTEEIRIFGDEDPREFTVRETRHGPVISDILDAHPKKQEEVLSIRWVATEPSAELQAIYRLNKATDWDSFVEAQRTFACPAQNMVYADREGTIGYSLAGRIPLRTDPDHLTPIPGWEEEEREWQGYIPFDALPRLKNPDEGYIVTANNKIVDNAYPYTISSWWEAPYRADRLHDLIGQTYKRAKKRKPLTRKQMMEFQLDVISTQGPPLCEELLAPIEDRADELSREARVVLNILLRWNGSCNAHNVGASCFHVFYNELIRRVFRTRLGETLFIALVENWNQAFVPMDDILQTPDSPWFDPQGRDDIAIETLERTTKTLIEKLGKKTADWAWGRLHKLTLRHAFHGRPLTHDLLSPGPWPSGGSGTTVNVGEFSYAHPFDHFGGAAYRQVIDLDDWDRSVWILAGGQSGNPASDHFADQASDYLDGVYREMLWGKEETMKGRETLTLEPPKHHGH